MNHLTRQLQQLDNRLFQLGQRVHELMAKALVNTQAIETLHSTAPDGDHAADVANDACDLQAAQAMVDQANDLYEQAADLEEACLGLIALHKPVANDQRRMIAVLKTKQDLMRIADLALNLRRHICNLRPFPQDIQAPCSLSDMGQTTLDMLALAMQAFQAQNSDDALSIRHMDDAVDDAHEAMYVNVEKIVLHHPEHIAVCMAYQDASRCIERAADQVTRIAKNVIYLSQGQIVRHQPTTG